MPTLTTSRLLASKRTARPALPNPSGGGGGGDPGGTPGNPNPKGKLLSSDYPTVCDPLHPTFAFAALGWTDVPSVNLTSVGFLFTAGLAGSPPSGSYLRIKAPSAISSYYNIYSDTGMQTALSFDTYYNQFYLVPTVATSLGGAHTAQNFPIYAEAASGGGTLNGSITFQVFGTDTAPRQSALASFDVEVNAS